MAHTYCICLQISAHKDQHVLGVICRTFLENNLRYTPQRFGSVNANTSDEVLSQRAPAVSWLKVKDLYINEPSP